MHQEYVWKQPKIIENGSKTFGNDIYSIHAGNHISGVSNEFKDENRNFYVWGGKTMIETISQSSTVRGSETTHGFGAHSRGGSQNTSGIILLDTLTEFSQPFMLALGYDNIAML